MLFIRRNDERNYMNLFENLFLENVNSSKFLRTDISETEDGYKLLIDLPGVDKKDINLDFNDQYLTLAVRHEENSDDSNVRYIRKERSSYSYSRSYYLNDADKDNIKAKLDNGVLTIMVGKAKAIDTKKTISVE